MDVNDDADSLSIRVALTFLASRARSYRGSSSLPNAYACHQRSITRSPSSSP
ncbi:hypothetical protein ACVWYU_003188 [Pseudomonas sp. TE12234]|uniref:Uncharacterized protein n=1 Tax=Pseudomonas moorei TaxID=395599 RepID=A0A1H1F9N5_9PSED|nr:hypothetical protein SAMN04490195_2566 [Pseudomonas moorei]